MGGKVEIYLNLHLSTYKTLPLTLPLHSTPNTTPHTLKKKTPWQFELSIFLKHDPNGLRGKKNEALNSVSQQPQDGEVRVHQKLKRVSTFLR
jgi:hypothetical protein